MHIDKIVGRLKTSERQLADAFILVSDRHSQDAEIRDVGRTIAAWSAEHVDVLGRIEKKYGTASAKHPDRLRSALFHDRRLGGLGLLEDLHDLGLLVQNVQLLWTELGQAARHLRDRDLESMCDRARAQTVRQLRWVLSQIDAIAPQALAVPAGKDHEVEAGPTDVPLAADHPAGGATALLVALDGISTMRQAFSLVIGACVLGVAGVVFRLIRSGRSRRKQEITRPRRFQPQLGPS